MWHRVTSLPVDTTISDVIQNFLINSIFSSFVQNNHAFNIHLHPNCNPSYHDPPNTHTHPRTHIYILVKLVALAQMKTSFVSLYFTPITSCILVGAHVACVFSKFLTALPTSALATLIKALLVRSSVTRWISQTVYCCCLLHFLKDTQRKEIWREVAADTCMSPSTVPNSREQSMTI